MSTATEKISRVPRKAYEQGLGDGVRMAFDHIEGNENATAVAYDGPLPDELKRWMDRTRKQLEDME